MLNDQFPTPPVDMVMPSIYSWFLVANFVVLALVMIWIVREIQRTKSMFALLMMLSAALASLTECIWDVLGAVWYPEFGHMFLALHSGQGHAATYPAATVTLLLSLTIVHLMSYKVSIEVTDTSKSSTQRASA